jgi:drug/metabolite transporter (DMT)-like permease
MAAVVLQGDMPSPPPIFYGITAVVAGVNIFANVLYLRAVKLSPLSLTIPYLSFTPVILLFTAWIILGEVPSLRGAIGVLAVTGGAYLLNKGTSRGFEPFRALAREPGSRLMLIVAFVWGITSSLDKLALRYAPPTYYGAIVLAAIGLPLLAWCASRGRLKLENPRRSVPLLLIGALVASLSLWAQYSSLAYLFVSYTIAIKRAGMILSVIIGHLFFHEPNARQRIPGAVVMVAGVLLITFG